MAVQPGLKFRHTLITTIVTTILGVLLAALPVSLAHAETATATANSANANTTSQNLAAPSVEDLIAISKTNNEAINDAVLGNEAIKDTLNNDALPINPTATRSASTTTNTNTTTTASATPRQSTEKGVAVNQLVLNEPVVDQARVLSPSDKQTLEAKLRALHNTGKAQMAVVIVPTTNGMDIFDYSMKIAEKWGLGKDGSDNGILMVVSINDRDMYILTGYGMEGTIPDAIAKRIISQDITPYFKQGDYAGGINAGIKRVEERLNTDPTVLKEADAEKQTQHEVQGMSPLALGVFGLIFGMFLTGILGRFLGSMVTAGAVFFGGTALGAGLFGSLIVAIILFFILLMRGRGRRGRGGGGFIILPGGFGGGFGGGGFGGGGGGFSGGGGDFGGGGAGGSW